MRNFKITLEYDGTDFFGWQVQPDLRTVQGELVGALEMISEGEVKVVGAGRTDTGVHAVGQVASARMETKLEPTVIGRALNARLYPDVFIRNVEEVSLAFNARFDATSRTYHYIIIRRPTALWRHRFYLYDGELDLHRARGALREVIGERDFTSFASSADTNTTKICNVIDACLTDSPRLVVLSITADHFLHHMVRTLAGTILEIGRGKPWSMSEIIEAKKRTAAGPTLPPYALYLMEVRY